MDAHDLVARLSGVRKSSRDGWMAKCPAHPDKTPSLSVKAMSDGRTLLHCFGGCATGDVLAAIGLEFRDVMPARLGDFPRARPGFTASDALRALALESSVVAIAASDLAQGRPMSVEDAQRIRIATGRIADALELVHGR
jgi:hypothetical protein